MIIGVTGGIGSGKSTVIKILKIKGFRIFSADDISREILSPGAPILDKLAAAFGNDIINREDGSLYRKRLGERAFATEEGTELLNSIVRGAVRDEMNRQIRDYAEEHPGETIIAEIPLLFEAGCQNDVDRIWVVTADEETRLKRVMERDCVSKEAARDRMSRQMSEKDKIAGAHAVIYNNSGLPQLLEQVEKLLGSEVFAERMEHVSFRK